MMKYVVLAVVLIGVALGANAGIIPETEVNDTLNLANPLGSVSYGDGVVGSINPVGDLDYFSFQPTFTAGYVDVTSIFNISLYASDHSLITTDTGTSLQLSTLTVGSTYYLGFDVPGNNTVVPSYTATFDATPVPEPELAGPVAAILLALVFGRRRTQ
jgi:hypothetical protein